MQHAIQLWRQRALMFLVISFCTVDSVIAAPGDLDTTFDTDGTVVMDVVGSDNFFWDYANDIAVQSDGRIVVVGGDNSFTVARFNADGAPDTGFGDQGQGSVLLQVDGDTVIGHVVVIQRDGKLVVIGGLWNGGNAVAIRLHPDGSIDSDFGTDGITSLDIAPNVQDSLWTAVLQPDDKILAAGSSGTELLMVRLNTDGALDASFGSGGVMKKAAGWGFNDIALQADGRIVGVSGSPGAPFMIVRLNADGSFDNTFDADGIVMTNAIGVFGTVTGVAVRADGRIVVSGYSNAPEEIILLRLNSNGALDTCFGSGGIRATDIAPTSVEIFDLILDSQERIIVVGQAVDSSLKALIARFTPDGDLDTTFGTNGVVIGAESTAWAVTLQSDDKIVIGGHHKIFSPTPARELLLQRFLNGSSAGTVPSRCPASDAGNSDDGGGGGGGGSIDVVMMAFAIAMLAMGGVRRRRSR